MSCRPQVKFSEAAASQKEEKKAPSTRIDALHSVMRAVRPMGRSGRGKGSGKPVKLDVFLTGTIATAAATALAASVGLQPSSTGEWAALASLYDECRVLSSTFHFRSYVAAAASSTVPDMVVAYDPIDITALPSVVAGLSFRPHMLLATRVTNSVTLGTTPAASDGSGFHRLTAKVHTDNARSTVATSLAGGWMAMVDAADVWGYWKVYLNASTGSATHNVIYYLQMTLECRVRQ